MLQSSIAWIDFSEQDRRKMMEVVALFEQLSPRRFKLLRPIHYGL